MITEGGPSLQSLDVRFMFAVRVSFLCASREFCCATSNIDERSSYQTYIWM